MFRRGGQGWAVAVVNVSSAGTAASSASATRPPASSQEQRGPSAENERRPHDSSIEVQSPESPTSRAGLISVQYSVFSVQLYEVFAFFAVNS